MTSPSKNSRTGSEEVLDVIVVGGGLAGATFAIAMAEGGASVGVIDARAPTTALEPTFDGRASAIARSSQRVLETIGVWPALDALATPIEHIRVAEKDSHLFVHYGQEDMKDGDLNGGAMGFMVENRHLRMALAKRFEELQARGVLHVHAPARLLDISRDDRMAHAHIDQGPLLSAPVIVGADGKDSFVRRWAGIGTTGWTYDQTGIVCTVKHSIPHENVACEYFMPEGPFAILPLQNDRSSLVWVEPTEVAAAIVAMDDAGFLSELSHRFGDFLGDLSLEGPRWTYPLRVQLARETVQDRLALVGDAAHVIHPIAGQGLNLGLRDVAALAEVLTDARRLGEDPGSFGVLERYSSWRRFDNTLMMGVTDFLNRGFSNRNPLLYTARNLGFAAVDSIRPVKRFFMKHAMGLVGDLPRMMKGEAL